jgi:signal transduction histidine kinase
VTIACDRDTSIRIADGGPGMDAFTAEHAFDRFFRGSDRGSVAGSGLGLAIVRRIVDRAGGSVTLETAPGKGTTVEVRVPRATPS